MMSRLYAGLDGHGRPLSGEQESERLECDQFTASIMKEVSQKISLVLLKLQELSINEQMVGTRRCKIIRGRRKQITLIH